MRKRYLVDSIVQEYKDREKYKRKYELSQFRKKHCIDCKDRNTYNCHITRNEKGELFCAFQNK